MSLEEIIEPYYEAVEEETLARVTNMLMQLEASTHAASVLKVRHLRSCQDRVLTRIRNQ